jgi:hypothetical protein
MQPAKRSTHHILGAQHQTAGATGNVLAMVYLPGGITTTYSDIGFLYPDGRPAQRIGIVPDIEVRATVAGIRAGRDEILEAVLRQVLQPPDTLTPTDWSWQPPFPQWNDLRAVYAVNADIIFAVGDLGTIVRTMDGGRTWVRQSSGTSNNLRGVWFTNGITGVAVGDLGTILRTTNGGTCNEKETNINRYRLHSEVRQYNLLECQRWQRSSVRPQRHDQGRGEYREWIEVGNERSCRWKKQDWRKSLDSNRRLHMHFFHD